MSEAATVSVETDGGVATLWLDNPERRNALGPGFWTGLPVLAHELSADHSVRAVVIAARGEHFTVGLDLTTLAGPAGGEAPSGARARMQAYAQLKDLQAAINAIADCSKPTIAAVQGYCLGGGVDLITACDIRLASADAVFGVRETRIALVADVGTLQRLPSIVGPARAAELVFTGRDVDAETARAIGLVSAVHADQAATLAAAQALGAEIAANSPLAVQGAKAVMARATRGAVAESLDYVALWNAAFAESNDLVEALTAFAERRTPQFQGH